MWAPSGCSTKHPFRVMKQISENLHFKEVYVSDLSPDTDEASLTQFFRGVASVKPYKDRKGKSLRNARITFLSDQFLQEAVLQNGTLLDKRPVIVSVIEAGRKIPLYTVSQKLPRNLTYGQVYELFDNVVESQFVLYLPLNQGEETNKGFCFTYFTSLEDYLAGLGLHNSEVDGREISVLPGLYSSGRGRRCL